MRQEIGKMEKKFCSKFHKLEKIIEVATWEHLNSKKSSKLGIGNR